MEIVAASSLIQLANHFKGTQVLGRPKPGIKAETQGTLLDLADIKGQESAKRALEIAAAGGHNLLMIGPPGSGKSMLAARLPTILPTLSPAELLEVSMIASVAGVIENGALTDRRPFRAPHHSASMPALVGGGLRAKPGEVSLAHHGVLFLDELPEFQPHALDALRQQLRVQLRRVPALGVRQQHQRSAAGDGGEDLLEVDVEGQRRELQRARRAAQAVTRSSGPRPLSADQAVQATSSTTAEATQTRLSAIHPPGPASTTRETRCTE